MIKFVGFMETREELLEKMSEYAAPSMKLRHPFVIAPPNATQEQVRKFSTGAMRATTFPGKALDRKQRPVGTGVLDYFPDAIVAVAHVSHVGNDQHNPGQPLHWAREKSTDEADAMIRHFMQRGTVDSDGVRHSAKMAWRALALLQKEIEKENHD